MIPYEELSAALERWRVKNGLPGTPPLFAEGSTMKRPTAAAPAPAPSPYSAPAPAPVAAPSYGASSYGSGPYGAPPAPPAPAPRVPAPPSPETLDEDVGEFAEDDVLAEAELDNEGPDYAMSFGAPPPPARPQLSPEDEHESTLLGMTDPSIVPPPTRGAATVVDDEDLDEYNSADKTPT